MPHADLPPLSREERDRLRQGAELVIATEVVQSKLLGGLEYITVSRCDLLRLLAQLDAADTRIVELERINAELRSAHVFQAD